MRIQYYMRQIMIKKKKLFFVLFKGRFWKPPTSSEITSNASNFVSRSEAASHISIHFAAQNTRYGRNNSNVLRSVILLCLVMSSYLLAPEDVSEFIIEKKIEKSSDEKKYSELHQNLLEDYEQLLRQHTQLLHAIADAQEQCIDALRKTVENTPKMSRERIKKEHERLQKLCESLKTVSFF